VLDGCRLFSLSVQQGECSILYLIKRILKGLYVALRETNEKVTLIRICLNPEPRLYPISQ